MDPEPVRAALRRPKSVLGTPQCTGPYARLRVNEYTRQQQAYRAWRMTELDGMSIRQAAEALGLSVTTTWRRAKWWADYTLGPMYGLPFGPVPHQRSTRACRRGRPIVLPLDAPAILEQLLAGGLALEEIADAARVLPSCIRQLAVNRMVRERIAAAGL